MEDQAAVEDATIGSERVQVLLMQFGVLRKILENLSARDLGRAALVNHAWDNVCQILRGERRCLHWFEWFSPNIGGKRARTSPKLKINEEMGRVQCVPKICLFFSSESINSIVYENEDNNEVNLERRRSPPSRNNLLSSEGLPHVIDHLVRMMPNTCTTFGLRAYGTIGTAWNLSNTVELRDKTSFSVLMIPNIPGVHIIPFLVQRESFKSLNCTEELSDEQLEGLTGISPEEQIRCLIVFCDSSDGEDVAELIIQTLLKRMDFKMAVGGGIGDQFFTNSPHSRPLLMGLAVSGTSVRALSAVIPQNVTKAGKIRETLEQLKSCDLPSENCIGFMFSCMGRCVGRLKREKGTESTLFREYFPTVPLIGFFGSGEIGINFIPRSDFQYVSKSINQGTNEPLFKKYKSNKELMHEYSTIFILLSLRRGS